MAHMRQIRTVRVWGDLGEFGVQADQPGSVFRVECVEVRVEGLWFGMEC